MIPRGTHRKMKKAREALTLAGLDLLYPIISKMFSLKVMSPSAGFLLLSF